MLLTIWEPEILIIWVENIAILWKKIFNKALRRFHCESLPIWLIEKILVKALKKIANHFLSFMEQANK